MPWIAPILFPLVFCRIFLDIEYENLSKRENASSAITIALNKIDYNLQTSWNNSKDFRTICLESCRPDTEGVYGRVVVIEMS